MSPITRNTCLFVLLHEGGHFSQVFLHILQHEHGKIKALPELGRGVDELIRAIRGESPGRACWPPGTPGSHTQLMVQAARAKCTLTCSFLYLAGALASLCTESSVSPLHAALEEGHWSLAEQMVKDMGGCVYVPDSAGRLPTAMLPPHLCRLLENVIYKKERSQLQDLQRKIRNNIVKQELKVQQLLFAIYSSEATFEVDAVRYRSNVFHIGSQALLEASRSGLQQLIYLLVKVGGLPVDAVVDPTSGTTALHQAASRGKSGVILLLLSLGAWPLLPDRYGQTPPHLASMFAHQHAYELFDKFLMKYNLYCRAGTVPQEIRGNFLKRLEMFNSCNYASRLSIHEINNDQIEATKNLLRHIDFAKLVGCTQKETIDFTSGEAQEIRDAVMKELQQIMKKIPSETFKGKLRLVGSSADGTRIGYPDNYDVNFVIEELPEVEVNILQQKLEDVLVSGHKLTVELKTEDNTFQGNNLITKFYKYVWNCLKSYILLNRKLSLVPPGLTRTRVGVKLSLAWQGSEYPLLLIDVDLVPVLVVPWPEEISRPYLTPDSSHMIHLSNTEDGTYICSFAATEVEVVQHLEPQEHQVFLTCKTLLSRMEAQPWMPGHMKNQFSWWDSRYWKIPTPAGFCLKNSFFKQVEKKRKKGVNWQKKDLIILVTSIFQGMCLETDGSSPGARSLVPAKINAYFGSECARSKVAEGAPEIVNFLRKKL